MRWATASAVGADVGQALETALAKVREGLSGKPADVAFVFVSREHAGKACEVPDLVRATLGSSVTLLGCTAGGVIGGGREHERQPAVSVLAGHCPGVTATVVHVEDDGLPDADAPPSAWHALAKVPPAKNPSFVVLCDPFTLRADSLIAGLDYAYPASVKVGGLASGADSPGEQAVFAGDRVHRSGAAILALVGDVTIVPAVAQGCRPVGDAARITKCEETHLAELDGIPALEVVRQVLKRASEADRALARTTLSIGIETDPFSADLTDASGSWLIRNIMGVDAKSGSLFVGERLRQGRRVRFHVRDRATSAEDLEKTLSVASRAGKPAAALLFSCLGRGMHMYGVPDHDTRAFHARFGAEVPVGGFFCSGEIGPVGRTTYLHGFTSSFGLIAPAKRVAAAGS